MGVLFLPLFLPGSPQTHGCPLFVTRSPSIQQMNSHQRHLIPFALALLLTAAVPVNSAFASSSVDTKVNEPRYSEGQNLVEQRCLACHGARTFQNANYGRLGWHFTITRMNWVNGAEVRVRERGPIVDYLSTQSEASSTRVIGEWLIATLLAAGGVALLWFVIKRRFHRH